MNTVFKPFLRKFILVFFDDILVYIPSLEEHPKHLAVVLEILAQQQLYANCKKCEFGQSRLAYLGHIISEQGVAMDPEKVAAMTNWPTPRNLKELKGFLRLTGYYRKYIAGYAHIAQPLTDQTRKDQFGWNEEATVAFEQLKQRMLQAPILVMPNFTRNFVVETDASGYGIGAVLSQEGHPIAYFSKVLGVRARLKSIYEKELMAIVLAVLKWRHYLLGRKFIIRTDQQSLKYLLEQREIGSEYQRWVSKLMGFDFEIQYRSGVSSKAADALSRKPPGPAELGVTISSGGQDGPIFRPLFRMIPSFNKLHVTY